MDFELVKEYMDIDGPGGNKSSISVLQENGSSTYPVSANCSGEGLPYAPQDWPNPGDIWGWKTGKRISLSGHFADRYLYLPKRLWEPGQAKGFASRLTVKQYIQEKFPDVDVDAFFASFSWRIPSIVIAKEASPENMADYPISDAQITGPQCEAGNRSCSSLSAGEDSTSKVMFCDICCKEPGFCRDCCCILCCQTIVKAHDNNFYIRCEAKIEGYICGHHCHVDCALRAYMAGTVGGSIDLDAQYYCRRCDSKTDLISYVGRLLKNCESIHSQDAIEKILKVGICLLRGSQRIPAKQLLCDIEMGMSKLKNGTNLGDDGRREAVYVDAAGQLNRNGGLEFLKSGEESQICEIDSTRASASNFDHRVESLKLEYKIDGILDALRKSQEVEYRIAEERLSAQKKYILNLYQQLDTERGELSKCSSKDEAVLLNNVLNRVQSIKREISKLSDMAEVAKGFGKVPKRTLKEQFGLDIEG